MCFYRDIFRGLCGESLLEAIKEERQFGNTDHQNSSTVIF